MDGNLDYFERYLAIQKVHFSKEPSKYLPNFKQLVFQRDDAMFAYGGDTGDKGPGDIRFTKVLLEFK